MALVLLLTAACGGSPTASNTGSAASGATAAQQVYDQINGLSGSERTNTLLDLAKKDGTLSLYTSNTDMDDVVKAFEDKYGLKVETYRANSETVLQRVLQESSANYQGADLIETNAGELNAMQQRQLLYPYQGELRDEGPPRGPQGRLDRRPLQRVRGRAGTPARSRQAPSRNHSKTWPGRSGRAESAWKSATSTGSPRCTTTTSPKGRPTTRS